MWDILCTLTAHTHTHTHTKPSVQYVCTHELVSTAVYVCTSAANMPFGLCGWLSVWAHACVHNSVAMLQAGFAPLSRAPVLHLALPPSPVWASWPQLPLCSQSSWCWSIFLPLLMVVCKHSSAHSSTQTNLLKLFPLPEGCHIPCIDRWRNQIACKHNQLNGNWYLFLHSPYQMTGAKRLLNPTHVLFHVDTYTDTMSLTMLKVPQVGCNVCATTYVWCPWPGYRILRAFWLPSSLCIVCNTQLVFVMFYCRQLSQVL